MELEVVWCGDVSRPSRGLLATTPEILREAPPLSPSERMALPKPQRPRRGPKASACVLALLTHDPARWWDTPTLAKRIQCPRETVKDAVFRLWRQGQVEREVRPRTSYRGGYLYAYRWRREA